MIDRPLYLNLIQSQTTQVEIEALHQLDRDFMRSGQEVANKDRVARLHQTRVNYFLADGPTLTEQVAMVMERCSSRLQRKMLKVLETMAE